MKAVFLDRDGVINKYPGDFQYVKSWEEFSFLPRAKSALKKLYEGGFRIFVISNQAGVSKGVYSQAALDTITQNMIKELPGSILSGVFYCIHTDDDQCDCRKPKAGLVRQAVFEAGSKGEEIDLKKSFFVGDTIRDIKTGRAAGLKTILVFSGKEKPQNQDSWQLQPDFTAAGLSQAATIILSQCA
jgi:histidinol-phosphate phosphatase family protein